MPKKENTTPKDAEEQKIPTEDVVNEIDEIKKKSEEYLNGWKRERADFLNYKKDEMERISALMKYANDEMILKLLPILDNFQIAEDNISDDAKKDENIRGLLLISMQIKDFLKAQGIEEIKTIGEKFDPNFHEVVQEVEEPEKESGTIVQETQKGYLAQGKVLRPSKVKVAK